MSKSSKNGKVPRLTEEQYAEYVTALKEETQPKNFNEVPEGDREAPRLETEPCGKG